MDRISYKYVCCITNLIQSHMEFHVQKKPIKNNNKNLVAVSFAFIGKIIKRNKFFVRDSLDNHFFTCKPRISRPNFPIHAKLISNEGTL